ncbi:MAG: hypothetical protein ACLUNO_06585 [Oscillospiraceae bacterium]
MRSSSATTTRSRRSWRRPSRPDLLILLSDIDGLYDRDPRRDPDAKLIETVAGHRRAHSLARGRQRLGACHRRHGHQAARGADRHGGRLRDGHRQWRKARGAL